MWFVGTNGVLHQYLRGKGSGNGFSLANGAHPPLTAANYFAQPRAVTLAPNGNLLVVCNDSGFVFRVNYTNAPVAPTGFRMNAMDTDGARMSWTGVFGRGYRVERSLDLQPGNWQPIGAAGGNPAGVATEFIDPESPAHPHGYYRLLPSL